MNEKDIKNIEKKSVPIALAHLEELLREGRKVEDVSDEFDFRAAGWHPRIYKDLEGAIDIHMHPAPDGYPRLLDDVEVAAQAKAIKMRAIVIKNMISQSPDRAYIAQRAVGGGIDVFGIICLNVYLGGFNVEAVKMAIRMGAKGVWMPAQWTAHELNYYRQTDAVTGAETIGAGHDEEGGLTILDDQGIIRPEISKIIELVAEADIHLSTGHTSLEECHALLDEANRLGVKKKIVHTVNFHVMAYPLRELEKMVKDKGAFIEFGFTSLPNSIWDPVEQYRHRQMTLNDVCKTIRTVGVENCVLSTDSGQTTSPPPIECMRLWTEFLKIKGFSKEEVDIMIKKNPAILLGLD